MSIYHLKMDKEKDFPTQLCINFVENSPCFALCNQILPHRQLVTPCCTNCPNYRKHPFHQHMQSRQHLAIWYIVKNYIVCNNLKKEMTYFYNLIGFLNGFHFKKTFSFRHWLLQRIGYSGYQCRSEGGGGQREGEVTYLPPRSPTTLAPDSSSLY